ncbi:hypothetical protein E4T56_gene15921 [Termitomyces sp. T112]|nr:hypothetical protein E4T56_gene15921 [Termitomyces sp. T112]
MYPFLSVTFISVTSDRSDLVYWRRPPAGIIWTAEEYYKVLSGDRAIHCLSRNEALAFVSEVGFLSLLFCFLRFLYHHSIIYS